MHQQIKFKCNNGQHLTPCPHGKHNRIGDDIIPFMVGSQSCMNCPHFVTRSEESVTCSFIGDMADREKDRAKERSHP